MGRADECGATRECQRLVEFCESFVKPKWCVGYVVFDVQVNVLVKRSAIGISARIEGECDVIDVVAGQEETGDVCGSSLVHRFERRERRIVAEDDNGGLYGRVDHAARDETSEGAMKELEPDCHSPQVFRIRVADHEQMIGADATPAVACLSGDGRESEENKENESNGSF